MKHATVKGADIEQALSNSAQYELIVAALKLLVRNPNFIHGVGIYSRNGECRLQDPYDAEYSIKSQAEQNLYYAALGNMVRPYIEHFRDAALPKKGGKTSDLGYPQNIVIENLVEWQDKEKGIATLRYIGITALDDEFEFFLVGLCWKNDRLFSYQTFKTELMKHRDAVYGIVKPTFTVDGV